jgi:hypothetical protein
VSLAALIAAYHEADEPGSRLRATLRLAGRTVVERQARLAAAAGAGLIVIMVERVPPELTAAMDRLKGEGLELVVARSVAEAAEAVDPNDRLLLVADGLIASEAHIARLTAVEGHAILTLPDVRSDDRHERIDAHSRWAGLAMLNGALLKETAAMLRDWDLQSTLLRRTVQAGARQLAVRTDTDGDLLVLAEGNADLADLEAQIFAGAGARRGDWVSRYLLSPVEQAATRALMPGAVTPTSLSLADTLLMALAILAFIWGWPGLGLGFLLVATPLEGISERLAALRLQGGSGPSWWASLIPVLAAGALLALAFSLAPSRGWGCIALAATTIAFILALRTEAEGHAIPGSLWVAERKGMAWLLLPFAVTGLWGTGLTLLAAYAGASFFWAQRHVHAAPPAPPQD